MNDETWEKSEEHAEQVFNKKWSLRNICAEQVRCLKRGINEKSKEPPAIICNLLLFKGRCRERICFFLHNFSM